MWICTEIGIQKLLTCAELYTSKSCNAIVTFLVSIFISSHVYLYALCPTKQSTFSLVSKFSVFLICMVQQFPCVNSFITFCLSLTTQFDHKICVIHVKSTGWRLGHMLSGIFCFPIFVLEWKSNLKSLLNTHSHQILYYVLWTIC